MLRNLRELYQYRILVWTLTQRELKARYRGSVLGFLWTFLNPTLLMLVYALLFGVYMKQSVEHYTFFMFIGLLPWTWFSGAIGGGASSLSDRRDLLTKVKFPAQVLPATVVLTNGINFLLSVPLMVVLGLCSSVPLTRHVVLFPLILAIQFVFTYALTCLISAMNVTFRDLQHVVTNLLTLAFFLTPVLYPLKVIPERFQSLAVYGNPMAVFVLAYQDLFFYHRVPQLRPMAVATTVSVVLMVVAAAYFHARREEFAELV